MSKTRNQRRRDKARLALIIMIIAWAICIVALLATAARSEAKADEFTQEAGDGSLPGDDTPATIRCYMTEEEVQEDYENEKIEAALMDRAHKIDDCTVTWYTADTCNKKPGDPGYGITASGLPVVDHLTCAVDPKVIPLYSDVFVEYADGTVEQLWATDTGIKGNHIDIYTPDYDYAIQMGRQKLTVWWVEE